MRATWRCHGRCPCIPSAGPGRSALHRAPYRSEADRPSRRGRTERARRVAHVLADTPGEVGVPPQRIAPPEKPIAPGVVHQRTLRVLDISASYPMLAEVPGAPILLQLWILNGQPSVASRSRRCEIVIDN
jgi:hypothetical protein